MVEAIIHDIIVGHLVNKIKVIRQKVSGFVKWKC